MAASDLIRAGLGNIAWKLHARDALSAEEASGMIEDLPSMPVEIYDGASILTSALEMAMATQRSDFLDALDFAML